MNTITETIVNSTNTQLVSLGVTGSITGFNVNNLHISVSSSSSLQRLLSTSTTQVSYLISSSQLSISQNSLSNAVTDSYTNGNFDATLHFYAKQNNATGLTAVTLASTPTVVDLSPTSSPTNIPLKTNKAAIGVGAFVFISIIAALIYIHMKKKIKSNTMASLTETLNPIDHQAPLGHRISHIESTTPAAMISKA